MKRVCFWTVAWGDKYEKMANTLALSFKKFNYSGDLYIFSKNNITHATKTIHMSQFISDKYLFKISMLDILYKETKNNYDYYVFVDCDSIFVKHNGRLYNFIESNKFTCFLEKNILACESWATQKRDTVIKAFEHLVESYEHNNYYSINGGFYSISSNEVSNFCTWALQSFGYLVTNGFNAVDEILISSYLMKCIHKNELNNFFIENWFDVYCIDSGGTFSGCVPTDKPFNFGDWFSNKEFPHRTWSVNPCLIHAPNSKDALERYTYFTNNKIELSIIIASNRQENIITVLNSIEKQPNIDRFNLKIIIMFDYDNINQIDSRLIQYLDNTKNLEYYIYKQPHGKTIGGHNAKNKAITDFIKSGFIYQLDDDNVLYPNFFTKISEILSDNINKKIFIFSQENRYKIVDGWEPKVGWIDTAMYLVDKSLIKNDLYLLPERYGGDGEFIQKIYNENKDLCYMIKQNLCSYNKLEKLYK